MPHLDPGDRPEPADGSDHVVDLPWCSRIFISGGGHAPAAWLDQEAAARGGQALLIINPQPRDADAAHIYLERSAKEVDHRIAGVEGRVDLEGGELVFHPIVLGSTGRSPRPAHVRLPPGRYLARVWALRWDEHERIAAIRSALSPFQLRLRKWENDQSCCLACCLHPLLGFGVGVFGYVAGRPLFLAEGIGTFVGLGLLTWLVTAALRRTPAYRDMQARIAAVERGMPAYQLELFGAAGDLPGDPGVLRVPPADAEGEMADVACVGLNGKQVYDYSGKALLDPAMYVPRLRGDDLESLAEKLAALAAEPRAGELRELVIGMWPGGEPSSCVIRPLLATFPHCERLTHVFVGDICQEENELSWIVQSDLGPLLDRCPDLRYLRIRGGDDLRLRPRSPPRALTHLIIETGGMRADLLASIEEFPALEHLELWLGEERYGWVGTADDIAALLAPARFPKLRHLGLRNSEITDDLVDVVVTSELLPQLRSLDLSLGTLSDRGAERLLAAPAVRELEALDLHHHFVTAPLVERLRRLGPRVNVSGECPQEDALRYIAIGE